MNTSSAVSVAIHGATGRMGTRLIQLIREDPALTLSAALDRPDHPQIGQDVGTVLGIGEFGVKLGTELTHNTQVVVDFSMPKASLALARACRHKRIALVVGTTGFEPEEKREVEEAELDIPVILSSNFSKAVNLLFKLAAETAKALGDSADIEIVERHHHFKKDAPSGTALRIAEVISDAIGSQRYAHGRSGLVGERPKGEIGLHALRTGDNPGEHTVVFGLMGECLELSHRALNRDGFARGALDAAKFLSTQPRGLYTMADLLGR